MGVFFGEGPRIASPGSLNSFYAAPTAPRKVGSRRARPTDPIPRPNRHGTTVVKARPLLLPAAALYLFYANYAACVCPPSPTGSLGRSDSLARDFPLLTGWPVGRPAGKTGVACPRGSTGCVRAPE